MINFTFIFNFIFIIFLVGCSSPQVALNGEPFQQKAISIQYVSNYNLNYYDHQSHVIPLVVYQLGNIDSFNSLKQDKSGLLKLLAAKKFDSSVMSVTKYFVAPQKKNEIILDRAEGTVWVALVTGYYDMEPSQVTLSYKIPEYNGWKFWKSESEQKFLNIKVYFDKSSIQKRHTK